MAVSISDKLIGHKGIKEVEGNIIKSFSKVVYELVNHLTNKKGTIIQDVRVGRLDFDVLEREIENYIDDNLLSVAGYERIDLINGVKRWLFLYFDYQSILDNPNVTEVRLKNRKCTIITVIDGEGNEYPKIIDETPIFDTNDEYNSFCNYIATRNEVELNKKNAIKVFTDETKCKDGVLRINIVNSNLVTGGSSTVLFAKTPKLKKSTEELEKLGMFNSELRHYFEEAAEAGLNMMFEEAAEAGLNMMFGGAGGAGKTNIMNALLEFVPDYMNTLVIQKDSGELHSNKRNMIFENISEDYSLKDLSLNAMKQRIGLFVIGELEGAETFDFFNAAYSGHRVWASMHYESPEEMIDKCIQYILYGDKRLSEEALEKMLSYMDSLIFMKDFTCFEATEIAGYDRVNKKVIYNPVFNYNFEKNEFKKLNDSCKKVEDRKKYAKQKKEKLELMASKISSEAWLNILKNKK